MAAVRAAKRHPDYRARRAALGSRCPEDLWIDGDLRFVTFRLADRGSLESLLAFAVRGADVVRAGVLTTDVTPAGWLVHHEG